MTEDWLIVGYAFGQGSHTCCDVSHCCNIWLDRKRQGFRNGELGHINGRTRPSGHENNETWDLRFSRWWICTPAVVSDMTTCSFVGRYRFVGGNNCLHLQEWRRKQFLRKSGNHIRTHTEPHYERITNRAARCLIFNWTHRKLSFLSGKKLYSTAHINVEDGHISFLNEELKLYSPNSILVMK